MSCPLKQAAFDAPHELAFLSKDLSFSFSELDRYVDTLKVVDDCLIVKGAPTLQLIALFFACFRQNKSIFPINPRLPLDVIKPPHVPPQSLLLFTSGSTAAPKIAVLSLANLLANASGAIQALDLRPKDQWLLSLPLYHVGGIGILIRCILARATMVLGDSPNITHLSYIPTHLYRATPIYKKLRCLLLGGAPILTIPDRLPIYTTYGLTEMGSMVTLNGQLLPNREVQIAPDGEILVRGPCLFQGYLGEESPNKDWFATGDLGRYKKELVITGRKDWMFISGGENIQPEEIERELLCLPEVIEAVVLPKDDAEFGKRPVAVVQARFQFNLKRMQSALVNVLPKYKIPIALYLVDEIPKKNNFKIDRFILTQHINNQLNMNTSGQKK